VTAAMRTQRLDFDDAYQYALAKREQATLVSFDTDFGSTDLVRQRPAQSGDVPSAAAMKPPWPLPPSAPHVLGQATPPRQRLQPQPVHKGDDRELGSLVLLFRPRKCGG